MEKLPRSYKVKFLDVGQTAVVAPEDIKSLPESLCKFPALAMKARLTSTLKEHLNDWNEKDVKFFRSLANDGHFTFTPIEFVSILLVFFSAKKTEFVVLKF
jgi:hypothetical protein